MIIQTSKKLPSIKELGEILKKGLSDQYSYNVFGLGSQSVLVGKSHLIGAQITIHGQEVSIVSSPPSVLGGFLQTLGMTELAIFILPLFGFSARSKYAKLEKEISSFIRYKYN
ncbi:MAG: hypothetical protein AAF519_16390 [Bacteroidota bacterium]